jgi:hypothetical protein
MAEDTAERREENRVRIEEIRSQIRDRLADVLVSFSADQADAVLAKVVDLLVWAVHHDRLKWAKDFERMVEEIDEGRAPRATARAAFASLAKSFRESIEEMQGGRDAE